MKKLTHSQAFELLSNKHALLGSHTWESLMYHKCVNVYDVVEVAKDNLSSGWWDVNNLPTRKAKSMTGHRIELSDGSRLDKPGSWLQFDDILTHSDMDTVKVYLLNRW